MQVSAGRFTIRDFVPMFTCRQNLIFEFYRELVLPGLRRGGVVGFVPALRLRFTANKLTANKTKNNENQSLLKLTF